MYSLHVVVTESLSGLTYQAVLYDIWGSGQASVVANHGPLTRAEPDEAVEDLLGLLSRAERYMALLEATAAEYWAVDETDDFLKGFTEAGGVEVDVPAPEGPRFP